MPANEDQPTERNAPAGAVTSRRRVRIGWVWGLALVAYATFLVYRGLSQAAAASEGVVPIWQFHDAGRLLAWFGGLVLSGLLQFAVFIPFGFLAAMAILRRPVGSGLLALAGVIGLAVAVLVVGRWWGLAAAAGLALAWLGCLLGLWMGGAWRRGPRARWWMAPKIAILVAIVAGASGLFLWLLLESEPLPIEAAAVTSARKRELVQLVRSKSPRSLEPGQTHTLRLSQEDVNVLLAWGLSIGAAENKANAVFEPNEATLAVSVPVVLAGRQRYVNLQLAGNIGVTRGRLRLDVGRFRLGRLRVPRGFVNFWCGLAASFVRKDHRTKPFLDAVEVAAVGSGWVEATYTRVDLPPGFREDLFGPSGASEEVLAATRAQVAHLLKVVNELPRQEPLTFELCFKTAFALAGQRSLDGDPIVENRAAIFALGILLGHERVEEFLGPVFPDQHGRTWVFRRVSLRDRTDWTRHFCLSAAIALLSDAPISDAAGLLKEELDAGAGGSGFSFADLLADRSGTAFAIQATRDKESARAMQERICNDFDVDAIFPSAAGLPEGITDAEFQSRYGGVGGREYLRLIDDIEQRVASCEAYR